MTTTTTEQCEFPMCSEPRFESDHLCRGHVSYVRIVGEDADARAGRTPHTPAAEPNAESRTDADLAAIAVVEASLRNDLDTARAVFNAADSRGREWIVWAVADLAASIVAAQPDPSAVIDGMRRGVLDRATDADQ